MFPASHPPLVFLLGYVLLSALASCESATEKLVAVPVAAQKALRHKFGTPLEQLRWQPDQDRLHASFVWKSIPVEVWLTAAGQVVETQLPMLDEDVPPALQDSLHRHHCAYQRQAMRLVETPASFHYALLLSPSGGPATRYQFRADGRRLAS